ncbi:MAG: hypothetical protein KTR30_37750 [Saprospiraceae bacterium]|nr:hypothetical protein [Saprospiraceae bacterium]
MTTKAVREGNNSSTAAIRMNFHPAITFSMKDLTRWINGKNGLLLDPSGGRGNFGPILVG